MTRGTKTGGRNFQPGVSGNPRGRPRTSMDIEALRQQSRLEVMVTIARSLTMTREELDNSLSDPRASLIQRLVGSILDKAIEDGCPQRSQFLMNYVLGRPKPYEAANGHVLEQQQANRSQELLKEIPSSFLIEVLQKHRDQLREGTPAAGELIVTSPAIRRRRL